MPRMLANFYQNSYVTTDIARAKDILGEHYGVKAYSDIESSVELQTMRGPGQVSLKVALAYVNQFQIELIQPLSGSAAWIYRDPLPASGFGMVFHHIACQVPGPIESWHEFRAQVGNAEHPIVFEGDVGVAKFVFLDARPRLGHYIEYVWTEYDMEKDVPRN